MSRIIVLILVLTITIALSKRIVIDSVVLLPTNYNIWAHHHLVWIHNSVGSQSNITDLVNQYLSHNIPVSAVNIDSTWETQFNNFIIDTNKYPNAKEMVDTFHKQNIKVMFWITSMINKDTDDWDVAIKNDYLVKDTFNKTRPIEWYHHHYHQRHYHYHY